MEMMDLRRSLLQPWVMGYGGLPVLVDNLKYNAANGKYNGGTANTDWFVTGFFDSGSSSSKTYQLGNPHSTAGTIRLFNDKTANSYDWWAFSVGGRSMSSGGRYIAFDVYKALADRYFVYDDTNGMYLAKGKNIEPGKTYGGLPVLVDNAYYTNTNGRFHVATENSDYFVAGMFDTGTTSNKSLTWSYTLKPENDWTYLRVFTSKFSYSADYWGTATYASNIPMTRTETISARYIAISLYKPIAADMYMYDNTNQRYVFKGSNVS